MQYPASVPGAGRKDLRHGRSQIRIHGFQKHPDRLRGRGTDRRKTDIQIMAVRRSIERNMTMWSILRERGKMKNRHDRRAMHFSIPGHVCFLSFPEGVHWMRSVYITLYRCRNYAVPVHYDPGRQHCNIRGAPLKLPYRTQFHSM